MSSFQYACPYCQFKMLVVYGHPASTARGKAKAKFDKHLLTCREKASKRIKENGSTKKL